MLALAVFARSAVAQSPADQGPPSPSPSASQPSHPEALRTLTTLREAHRLSAGEASRGYPIHVRAVVTYYDDSLDSRRIAFFLHDRTGGIYAAVLLGTTWPGQTPLPGTLVDVSGVSAPGDFAPIIDQARITFVADSQLPAQAKPVTLPHLLTGAEDGQWVEIEGVVHSVVESASNITLEVATADGTIGATTVKRVGTDYDHLVDATVRLHGNAAPLFNSNRQMTGVRLFFPGRQAITVLESGPRNVFALPAQPIANLSRFAPAASTSHRMHVRGTVTLQWPGKTVCIQDGTQGLCAQTSQKTPLAIGSQIDLAGFTTLVGFKPAFDDAIFQPLPGSATVAPIPVTPEQALQGSRDSDLVQIDGRLMGQDEAASDATLILSSGKSVFRVILPVATAGSSVSAIPIGSKLRVTGICSVQVDTQGTLKGYGATQGLQFSILLRSPQSIVILKTPSWWTSGRIGSALIFTLAITTAGFIWVFVLRRRVEQQTRELRQSRELYRHMAHHDELTGLPTRTLLRDRLQSALDRARRFHKSIALLMLDLDKFKQINDSFGHDCGDLVLQITAERIASAIRKTDSVARMGGDEFIVLLNDLADDSQAKEIAAKIVDALSVPIRMGKIHVPVSVSVGVCAIAGGAVDAEVLLKRVDAAMYRAKERGRSCFQVFTDDMIDATRDHLPGAPDLPAAALPAAAPQSRFSAHPPGDGS